MRSYDKHLLLVSFVCAISLRCSFAFAAPTCDNNLRLTPHLTLFLSIHFHILYYHSVTSHTQFALQTGSVLPLPLLACEWSGGNPMLPFAVNGLLNHHSSLTKYIQAYTILYAQPMQYYV